MEKRANKMKLNEIKYLLQFDLLKNMDDILASLHYSRQQRVANMNSIPKLKSENVYISMILGPLIAVWRYFHQIAMNKMLFQKQNNYSFVS